jgi:hypothetical protein
MEGTVMNMEIWDKVKRPPASALKTIQGGRLKGMSDISPVWRLQAMTEVFGACGSGWHYEIVRLWTEPGTEGQVVAFAQISLFTKDSIGEWSAPIPGIGGSMLIAKEKSGLYTSDEAYKMAVTDALSVAMKALGVASDVYLGLWDGSKYKQDESQVDENVKRAVSEWKQNIDQVAENATLKELREYWPTTKAEIIHDCGQVGASEVYEHLKEVGKRMASLERVA